MIVTRRSLMNGRIGEVGAKRSRGCGRSQSVSPQILKDNKGEASDGETFELPLQRRDGG